jgi:hypothetical protein
LFFFKVSQMGVFMKSAAFCDVYTGFVIGTVNDAIHKVVICADSRRVIRIKASKNSQVRVGACLFTPFGNTWFFLRVINMKERSMERGSRG